MILPMKSEGDTKQLFALLGSKKDELVEAPDAIGTLHFARLVNFPDLKKLGFLTVFDGDFRQYFSDFLKFMGPLFDALFSVVVDGPPVPSAKNKEAFIDWSFAHNPEGIGFYSAYPTLSVQDIRARAKVSQGALDTGQSALALVLTAKSPSHLMSMSQLINQSLPTWYAAAERIGTLHFARFLPLGTSALLLIAEYDGTLEKLSQNFSTHLGPTFDAMFEHVVGPPPTSVQKNADAFTDWVSAHNLKSYYAYSAYPTLSAQAVRSIATA
jgi:hypothetical protein